MKASSPARRCLGLLPAVKAVDSWLRPAILPTFLKKWLVIELIGLGRLMYAVIKTGGKQYKVSKGDVLRVEKLTADAGEIVSFDQILMLGDDQGTTVGTPHVTGAEVEATVLEQARDDKIIVFKKRRRKNSRRKNGHRQALTVLRVTKVLAKPVKAKVTSKKAAKKIASPKKRGAVDSTITASED